jgi:tetratricopeptide (TPR) repeat protein
MQGDFAKSLALLNSIPDDEETMYQKSLIFMKLGQYQKALAYALTLKNQDERTLELIGDIWLSLGDLKAANQTYSKILEDQRNAKVNFLLGLTLFDTNPDEAENYFKLSKEQDPKYFAQAQKQYNAVAKLIRGKNGRN